MHISCTSCTLKYLVRNLPSCGLSCGRRSVDQFVLVSGSPLGPMTRFYLFLSFDNYSVVLPIRRPLWREDGSVTSSAIADWPGQSARHLDITVSSETVFSFRRLLRLAGTAVEVFQPSSTPWNLPSGEIEVYLYGLCGNGEML
jgi:hypothetical protein